MKLVIQIPCRDEAASLPLTISALPKVVVGIDEIEIVVIDDGSSDKTSAVAATLGVHIVRLPKGRGLAGAFITGIDTALLLGADIIVNTDGDNQYAGEDVGHLVAPVVSGAADIVIGERPIASIEAFSTAKKLLQRAGSWVIRRLSGADVVDATSGFRAYSREAALQMGVYSQYTYTLETIVQAATHGMRIASVPVRVNVVERPSRLARSSAHYIWRAGTELARMFVVYRPFRFFILPAGLAMFMGVALVMRFLWLFVTSGGAGGHLQSLVVAWICFGIGGALVIVALLGDLIAINRRMVEEIRLDGRRRRFTRSSTRPPLDTAR